MRPDAEMIRSLVLFLEREGLEEICYEVEGVRIKVRKEPPPTPVTVVGQSLPLPNSPPLPRPKTAAPAPPQPKKTDHRRDVLSPMAGIFYRAPSPGAEPFIDVGDAVDSGQTVALVEAMKTFNEVATEFAGRVIEFYVQDTEAVRGGQPIIALEPLEVEV